MGSEVYLARELRESELRIGRGDEMVSKFGEIESESRRQPTNTADATRPEKAIVYCMLLFGGTLEAHDSEYKVASSEACAVLRISVAERRSSSVEPWTVYSDEMSIGGHRLAAWAYLEGSRKYEWFSSSTPSTHGHDDERNQTYTQSIHQFV
ncbi:hypothetical protein BV25DRAFT_207109 [Artomyces pyxidatus]|uniref:Uncharacterized protein n=1 Tax=Artomyces pyxidatus TaxID=48021 RepID=A0ACB8TA57_9AGAM|nr:hypothetical protein BV25DRAFT_207109 [Artomyces pyxidatus]